MKEKILYFILCLFTFVSINIFTNQTDTTQDIKNQSYSERFTDKISKTVTKWKNKLSSVFDSTQSHWIRIIIALILGVLLSLTPCIYPMIPITIGILQINQSKSTFQSFLLAAAYTLGISITFTIFGLIAALGSSVFGQLQGSPIFIIPLVALLLYFGLSMFGFYEIYIPKFLQPKQKKIKGGSLISAFIFGLISGSVASPCLSPGLLLILNYISQLNSTGTFFGYFEGFVLLFLFGIGSSLPLLIIGTFSASMNIMPRAGVWMLEVKKIFGIMLIGMAFYNLSHLEYILPWYILSWIITASLLLATVYYLKNITKHDSLYFVAYKIFVAIILFIASGFMGTKSYKAVYNHFYNTKDLTYWTHNYNTAKNLALKENKPLFIDIGATYCGSCKAIDHKIFQNSYVISKLKTNFVPLKIEADLNEEDFEIIKKEYKSEIKGFPTFLIINPKNNLVIKKWTENIEELGIDNLIQELDNILNKA